MPLPAVTIETAKPAGQTDTLKLPLQSAALLLDGGTPENTLRVPARA